MKKSRTGPGSRPSRSTPTSSDQRNFKKNGTPHKKELFLPPKRRTRIKNASKHKRASNQPHTQKTSLTQPQTPHTLTYHTASDTAVPNRKRRHIIILHTPLPVVTPHAFHHVTHHHIYTTRKFYKNTQSFSLIVHSPHHTDT